MNVSRHEVKARSRASVAGWKDLPEAASRARPYAPGAPARSTCWPNEARHYQDKRCEVETGASVHEAVQALSSVLRSLPGPRAACGNAKNDRKGTGSLPVAEGSDRCHRGVGTLRLLVADCVATDEAMLSATGTNRTRTRQRRQCAADACVFPLSKCRARLVCAQRVLGAVKRCVNPDFREPGAIARYRHRRTLDSKSGWYALAPLVPDRKVSRRAYRPAHCPGLHRVHYAEQRPLQQLRFEQAKQLHRGDFCIRGAKHAALHELAQEFGHLLFGWDRGSLKHDLADIGLTRFGYREPTDGDGLGGSGPEAIFDRSAAAPAPDHPPQGPRRSKSH